MTLEGKRIGFIITGSFCTWSELFPILKTLLEMGAEIQPIFSYNASSTDTRFMMASEMKAKVSAFTGKKVWDTIAEVEAIGPKKLFDIVAVVPCTGNTATKIANGISDTPATLACKAHLRNDRAVVLALSTNDALAANAVNIGKLLNTRHIYFAPMCQDDCINKPRSLSADLDKLPETLICALEGRQVQPIFTTPIMKG